MEKAVTEFMKQKYRNYLRSDMKTIWDLYDRPSKRKINAFFNCKDLFNEMNGENFKVVGGNSMIFSVGFTCDIDGEPVYVHITRDHDRYIPLKECSNVD